MVLAPACLGDFNLKREKSSTFKGLKYNLLSFLFVFVMLVSVLKMKKPVQGFSTSMSVVWLSVAWIMMIDYGIEKPGIMTEGTTQEMMCNFISVSEWGENNRRFWAWKHPEDISLGLLRAVAIQVGIPENISPQQLDYEWQWSVQNE